MLYLVALKNTFRKLDTNNDGKIGKRELRIACRKLGILLTKDEVQEIFAEADANGKAFFKGKLTWPFYVYKITQKLYDVMAFWGAGGYEFTCVKYVQVDICKVLPIHFKTLQCRTYITTVYSPDATFLDV